MSSAGDESSSPALQNRVVRLRRVSPRVTCAGRRLTAAGDTLAVVGHRVRARAAAALLGGLSLRPLSVLLCGRASRPSRRPREMAHSHSSLPVPHSCRVHAPPRGEPLPSQRGRGAARGALPRRSPGRAVRTADCTALALSCGERQRVAIARSSPRPDCVPRDEPTATSPATADGVFALMRDLRAGAACVRARPPDEISAARCDRRLTWPRAAVL